MYSTTTRMTGLTGLDTSSMVTQLMKAESMKYDKLFQQRELLKYTQDSYRSVATNLQSIRTANYTFGNSSKELNFRSASNYTSNSTTLTSSSGDTSSVSVSSSANAVSGNYEISVNQLAAKDVYTGSISTSGGITNSGTFDASKLTVGDSISFTLDSTTKSITFTGEEINAINVASDKNAEAASIVNAKLGAAFKQEANSDGVMVNKVSVDSNFNVSTLPGHTVSIAQASGTSAKPQKMQELLRGESITVNGTNISFTDEEISNINLSSNPSTEALTLLNTKLGDAFGQTTNDAGETVNNVSANSNFKITTSGEGSTTSITDGDSYFDSLKSGAAVSFSVGNSTASISFTQEELDAINAEADPDAAGIAKLNEKLKAAFGETKNEAGESVSLVTVDSSFNVTVAGENPKSVTIDSTTPDSKASNVLLKSGFDATSQSSAVNANHSLEKLFGITGDTTFTINDVSFTFDKSDSLSTVMNKVNNSNAGVKMEYSTSSNKFILQSKTEGAANAITINSPDGFLSDKLNLTQTQTAQDSIVVINGVTTTRSTNTVDIDGLKLNLLKADPTSTITVGVEKNSDSAKATIVAFVENYNKILDSIYEQSRTTRPTSSKYSYYQPLTSEERSALSDKDAENWDKKAKEGLLYNDPILNNIETQLRDAMLQPVELADGRKISLSEFGIQTGDYSTRGKLVLDEKKLDKALEKYGDDVADIFTKSSDISYKANGDNSQRMKTEGFAERINDIMENAIGSRGLIANKAGIKNTLSETQNDMQTKITAQDQKLADMLTYLQDKEDYYFSMFSRMETAMMQADSQMSALSSMLM